MRGAAGHRKGSRTWFGVFGHLPNKLNRAVPGPATRYGGVGTTRPLQTSQSSLDFNSERERLGSGPVRAAEKRHEPLAHAHHHSPFSIKPHWTPFLADPVCGGRISVTECIHKTVAGARGGSGPERGPAGGTWPRSTPFALKVTLVNMH